MMELVLLLMLPVIFFCGIALESIAKSLRRIADVAERERGL